MQLTQFLAGQAKMPDGFFGRHIMGRIFDVANAPLNDFALGILDLKASDKVLEIGFGRGGLLSRMAKDAKQGLVAGIDLSRGMVDAARKKNRHFIEEGMVKVDQANLQAIPYPDRVFDKVFTGNTIYFWPDPVNDIHEIKRVMKPGAKLVIGFRTKEQMENIPLTRYEFRLYSEEDVCQLLCVAGFSEVSVMEKPQRGFNSFCAVATK